MFTNEVPDGMIEKPTFVLPHFHPYKSKTLAIYEALVKVKELSDAGDGQQHGEC
jgi:hypothetical protein